MKKELAKGAMIDALLENLDALQTRATELLHASASQAVPPSQYGR